MVKRALKSKTTANSISSTSAKSSEEEPKCKMVLRVRQTEKTKKNREIEDDIVAVKEKKAKTNSKKKITNKSDSRIPKKPPTAFFYFLEDFRKEYQEQNPHVKSMRDVGKAGGEKWKTMKYEEKVHYYDIATIKRAEFDDAMAEYIKKKESGEDQELGSNSESD